MEFLYYFANASLTQRVLNYLLRQLDSCIDSATVIFLNDRWVVDVKLNLEVDDERNEDCWAFFSENGTPYHPGLSITSALNALNTGLTPTQVMSQYHIAIVSRGKPDPQEVACFQKQVIEGLGYCPETLA